MKRKLLFVLRSFWVLAISMFFVSCGQADHFVIDSVSPTAMYRINLQGRTEPARAWPWEIYTQTVSLQAWKNSNQVVKEEKFFHQDSLGELFLQAFPIQEWIDPSTFRLGDLQSKQSFHDEIVVRNRGKGNVKIAIVQYANYERFILFDLEVGEETKLPATPHSNDGTTAPIVHYRAFFEAGSSAGNIQAKNRMSHADGPLKIIIEIKE